MHVEYAMGLLDKMEENVQTYFHVTCNIDKKMCAVLQAAEAASSFQRRLVLETEAWPDV